MRALELTQIRWDSSSRYVALKIEEAASYDSTAAGLILQERLAAEAEDPRSHFVVRLLKSFNCQSF